MYYISNIIEIIATFTEAWICICFALVFICKNTDIKNNIVKILLGAAIYTIIVSLCNSVQTVSNYITFFTVILLSIINFAISKKDYTSCLIVSALFVIFQAIIEMIIICIFSIAANDPDYIFKIITTYESARIIFIFTVKGIIIALYFALKNKLLKINSTILRKPSFMVLTAAELIITLKMMSIIISNGMTELKIGISMLFIGFIITTILILYLFDRLLNEQIEADEQNYLIIKNSLLENNLKNINRLYDENSKSFHEFKHHINALSIMLKNKQFDKMEKYFSEISAIDNNIKFKTGNEIIDIVLNVENFELKNKGILFDVIVDIPKILGIKDSDLCSILLNIIDNATEAVENESNKSISISIKHKGNMLVISSSNYCSFDPIAAKFETSKSGNHGWGLKIINDIVQKYDGAVNHSYEKNMYYIDVLLILK